MRKLLLSILLSIQFSGIAFSQQWLHFTSGTDSKINVGDIAVQGDSITIEALITLQLPAEFTVAADIVSKHTNMYDCSYLFRPTDFAIRTTSGFANVINSKELCWDSTYHVAATYDGDSIKFFVNGIQTGSTPWTGSISQNSINTGIGNLTTQLDYFNEQFMGYLDEVRIWKVARTPSDLANNMFNLPEPETQYGLVAYYKFDGDYTNIQGDINYTGLPVGTDFLIENNSLFTGEVAEGSCTPLSNLDLSSEDLGLLLFPVPVNDMLSVEFSSRFRKVEVAVFNTMGEQIIEKVYINDTRFREEKLDVTVLSAGVYFLHVKTENELIIRKFIKK